ncbi:phosphoethanolamine--lipid A transferase [Acidovorax sp. SUPP2539]|uniref:phosphoethanolamine transferase n=1 Tax=Acidovorax sp. SUPP2539 TaxID=2920878 RepID=UPI0023DE4527|nr:phosphoethanolamine--lipid A transferase [Acidovorax sp. SUPP2539]GKS90771.1 phosphoethanolamine--lipid A transferase [Acidovorax sp. SUPP2539]
MAHILQPQLRLITKTSKGALGHAGLDPRNALHPAWIITIISLWLATACNVPLWRALLQLPNAHSLRGWAFLMAFVLAVAAANAAVIGFLAWGRLLKPMLAMGILLAALGSYFMTAYGIVIDTGMITNVLQTDPREAADLLDWRLPLTIVALAGPPLWWLARTRVKPLGFARQIVFHGLLLLGSLALAAGLVFAVFQDFSSAMRNHTQLRYLVNPLNSIYAVGNAAARPLRRDAGPLMPLGRDARLGASYAGQGKPPLLVLVLGETGRSGNFGLNGYGRPTTPELSARNDLVSARNAWSCGTSTAASVPCMFSNLGRTAYEASHIRSEGLLDVLQHAGLAVLWVDNQSGCKGVCDRVAEASTSAKSDDPQWCADGKECLDDVMLKGLDARIAALPSDQRARGTVVVLHQMGSHGPAYFKRSLPSQKTFQPECRTSALQECQRQEVVNAYDNSIVSTDHFLNATIQWLAAQSGTAQTAMMYVADHGESLGENNIYLHGMPYAIAPDVQKHVPWITWLSPAMQSRTRTATACLQKDLGERRLSHDHYFHSILGLMDVQTSVYEASKDMFATCRGVAAAG